MRCSLLLGVLRRKLIRPLAIHSPVISNGLFSIGGRHQGKVVQMDVFFSQTSSSEETRQGGGRRYVHFALHLLHREVGGDHLPAVVVLDQYGLHPEEGDGVPKQWALPFVSPLL